MSASKGIATGAVALVVAAAVVAVAFASGDESSQPSSAVGPTTRPVDFEADAGAKNVRILSLGGVLLRASCTDYGQGRVYLSVAAKSQVNNAARALVLSQRRGGEATTYSFKSSDFDPSFGYYDITGTNPYRTTGTFSFARPDGGQVAVTYRADQGVGGHDCTFAGLATYAP